MKTRQEMIYEFMVALASNSNYFTQENLDANIEDPVEWIVDEIAQTACVLADKYLEGA